MKRSLIVLLGVAVLLIVADVVCKQTGSTAFDSPVYKVPSRTPTPTPPPLSPLALPPAIATAVPTLIPVQELTMPALLPESGGIRGSDHPKCSQLPRTRP